MPADTSPDAQFEHLLEYLRVNRGFDFTGYKRSSVMRRVARRMQVVGIPDYDAYLDFLEVHPDEFTQLFNTILINVTRFFRDDGTWEFVREAIVPDLVQRRSNAPIRVWSAGCASGQEPYSVAMLFAEALGLGEVRDRLKIYATDVDEEALATARSGVYTAREVESIGEELRAQYLEPVNGGYGFRKELRRAVIFGRHDLVSDPPISRIDLLLCRNTLMYFNADLQSQIYRSFHFSLDPDGYLCLGKSEMLLTRTAIFTPLDLKRRIFRKVPGADGRDRLGPFADRVPSVIGDSDRRVLDAAFESSRVAQIAIDLQGVVVSANALARSEFGVTIGDVGRPFQDLEISYRPVELRSRIELAQTERRPVVERGLPWPGSDGDQRFVDIQVAPLLSGDGPIGSTVTFVETTEANLMRVELERSQRELETAYEEIQSTVEELETTNEELQSTNEELETTNEELQSTNEELETMNEELQSTNEELETINTELRDRTGQLNEANSLMESVLRSLNLGVAVLDRNLAVRSWNATATEMWGLAPEEVRGKHLLNLDIGLPLDQLRDPLRACVTGKLAHDDRVLDAVNRRGRPFRCHVVCNRLDGSGQPEGVILLMEGLGEG
jgi:two-component system, chemotaxis family, CheB/CheR fusion protein